ncbi:extracellular solute-binding protein [Bifidobacterium mongoliense]|jgi:multiple sugar transport system substrate-binding protein|uniref:extracellular solute-binding protein n=1 Tax=Bifidobacterium mongoliense TaxID=518643 RepID=UPI0030EE8F77
MVSRRDFLRLSLGATVLGAGALSLAGCGRPADANYVDLWGLWANDLPSQQAIINKFKKIHPEFKVKQSQVPASTQGDASAVITAVRSGTAPDLWLLDRFTTVQYAAIGLLEPIDPIIKQYDSQSVKEIRDQWLDFTINEMTYRDQLYGLPFTTDSRVLVYNKGALRKAGIDFSALDPKNGAPTFDEVWDIADQFTKTDAKGNYTALGFIPWEDQGSLYTWANNNGATFYDDGACSVTMLDPKLVESAKDFAAWVKKLDYKKVDTFAATYEPPNHPPAQSAFNGGRLAMQVMVPSSLSTVLNYVKDLEFGITSLPVKKKGDKPKTWSGGFGLCVPKGAHKSKMMWDFMKFYCSEPGESTALQRYFALPASKKALERKAYPKSIEFFADALALSSHRPAIPVGNLLWDSLGAVTSSIQQGSATPEQALETAQKRIQPQLQPYCVA